MSLNLTVQNDIFYVDVCLWLLFIFITNFLQLFPRMKLGKIIGLIHIKTPLTFEKIQSLHCAAGIRDLARK